MSYTDICRLHGTLNMEHGPGGTKYFLILFEFHFKNLLILAEVHLGQYVLCVLLCCHRAVCCVLYASFYR